MGGGNRVYRTSLMERSFLRRSEIFKLLVREINGGGRYANAEKEARKQEECAKSQRDTIGG